MKAMVCLLALIVTLAGCGGIKTLDQIILRPSHELTLLPSDYGYAYDVVELVAPSGATISAWHVKSDSPRGIVVIVPGSDANKSLYCEALPLLVPYGYDVLLFDYEGFGESSGDVHLQAVIDDAFVVTDYAKSTGMRVVLFGVSIGTPAVARVAADRDLAGCIFEGTLILDREIELYLAMEGYPPVAPIANLWVGPQIPPDYDIMKYIQLVSEPKHFQHSSEDDVTPYDGALMVYDLAPEPKDFWTMYGGHGKMIRLATDEYAERVRAFLSQVLPGG